MQTTEQLLQSVAAGILTPEQALKQIQMKPYQDIDYAKIDLHRQTRQRHAEVIYGASKTPEQMIGIIRAMRQAEQNDILITRLQESAAEAIQKEYSLEYHADAKLGIIGKCKDPDGLGTVLVAAAGTSDLPVANEAALTARFTGNRVKTLFDVGVAGIHRLLSHTEEIFDASVIIVIAGMDGALASVIGGLAACPVIAVPTSVGYGAAFGGVSALLAMLNSCAAGTAVMNIDNGFGAAMLADRINHPTIRKDTE